MFGDQEVADELGGVEPFLLVAGSKQVSRKKRKRAEAGATAPGNPAAATASKPKQPSITTLHLSTADLPYRRPEMSDGLPICFDFNSS